MKHEQNGTGHLLKQKISINNPELYRCYSHYYICVTVWFKVIGITNVSPSIDFDLYNFSKHKHTYCYKTEKNKPKTLCDTVLFFNLFIFFIFFIFFVTSNKSANVSVDLISTSSTNASITLKFDYVSTIIFYYITEINKHKFLNLLVEQFSSV